MNQARSFQALRSLQHALTDDINTFSDENLHTVVQLPVELLTSIFRYAKDGGLPFERPDGHLVEQLSNTRSLMSASQVCSRWRSIALSDPSLWTDIPAMHWSHEFIALLLERSGSMPLRVLTQPSESARKSIVKSFARLKEVRIRIKELVLTVTDGDRIVLDDILCPLGPSLTYLNLSVSPSHGTGDIWSYSRLPTVRKRLFSRGRASEDVQPELPLKALSISLAASTLPDHRFQHLIHLRITANHRGLFHPGHLISLLQDTPRLRTLSVYNVDYPVHYPVQVQPQQLRPARLDHLRVLYFDQIDLGQTAYILTHLILPTTVMVQLHRIAIPNPTDLHHLELPGSEDYTELEIAEQGEHLHFRIRGAQSSLWLHIKARAGEAPRRVSKALPSMVLSKLALRISGVKTLRIGGPSASFDSDLLKEVLPVVSTHCPSISTLVVASDNHQRSLSGRVLEGLIRDESESSVTCPLPGLEHLAIQVFRPLLDSAVLVDLAKRRSEARCPLSSITFSAPAGALAMDGDNVQTQASALEAFEALVSHVSLSSRRLWRLSQDEVWRVEHKYWPLYPSKVNIASAWGLPSLGDGWWQ
ncbi:hypothetical protein C8Q76DRAFT_792745 [Earliella scabrosa]|nr:hypothetical protein C8Q76DRAFT_792745 [Earliella scabrosa]